MRPLNVVDHVFLLLENQKTPMHVAGLCVFDLPDDAPKDFVARLAREAKTSTIKPSPPFNQVLHRLLFWKTDDDFNVDCHFCYAVLPKPSGMCELMSYVSNEHELIMDRAKSLWEFHLIDGIAPADEGGNPRFALFLKIHHAMADGVAVMRLLQMSFSTSPTEKLTLPFWSSATKHRNYHHAMPLTRQPFLKTLKEQLNSVYPVGVELGKGLLGRFKKNANFVSTFDAPPSILNQKITNARHVAFASFDKGRFSRIARRFGASTNDVLLAVCGGAIRQYLLRLGELPKKPLIAFVPISIRRDGSAVGNQLSFILANLATHEADPVVRLSTIKASVDDGKQRFARMSPAQVVNYSLLTYGWAFANLVTGAMPTHQAFNLIISNVPGGNTPLYLNGAKLTGIFPASVLMDGQALNITFANYQDKIDFGIVACQSILPNIEDMIGLLEDELMVFEQLVKDMQRA